MGLARVDINLLPETTSVMHDVDKEADQSLLGGLRAYAIKQRDALFGAALSPELRN